MDNLVNEINDNELELVNGGVASSKASRQTGSSEGTVKAHCPFCNKETNFVRISGSRGKCQTCGNVSMI